MAQRKFEEVISADKQTIGFDYQHYYSLLLLLQLKADERLGIEVKEDIHIEKPDGKFILLQLKHSTQRNKDGKYKNFTEREPGLWHTISNWITLIKEGQEQDLDGQLKFISNREFLIVSNKSNNTSNNFLLNIEKLKKGEIKIKDFITYLTQLEKETKEDVEGQNEVKAAINLLLIQKEDFLNVFLMQIDFKLDESDVIEKIKKTIEVEYAFDEKNVEDVLFQIEGLLRITEFIKVSEGFKKEFSKEEFSEFILKPCFYKSRNLDFVISDLKNHERSPEILKRIFAKQLFDLGTNEDSVFEKDYLIQLCITNLKKWSEKTGIITVTDIDNFMDEAKISWNSEFNKIHRRSADLNEQENLYNARDCFDTLMNSRLQITNVPMDLKICNGIYCYLSDGPIPKIGWMYNWKTIYINEI